MQSSNNKVDKYFIALAQDNLHTFLMLGVIQDGVPTLLANVGKTFGHHWYSPLELLVSGTTQAILEDHGILADKDAVVAISYQAYYISHDQALEFLGVISEVKKPQSQYIDSEQTPDGGKISFLVPDKNKFIDKFKLSNSEKFPSPNTKNIDTLIKNSQSTQINDNCRTTALEIMETIQGYVTNISKYFFIAPKHQTVMKAGKQINDKYLVELDRNSFYVLPPPPYTIAKNELTDIQLQTLNTLYERMEAIPKINPKSAETRAKFEAVESLYNEFYQKIVGKNELPVVDLLEQISTHAKENSKALFAKRGWISRFFHRQSATKIMFEDLKKPLMKKK